MLNTLMQHKFLVVFILAVVIFGIYLLSQTPSHNKNWVATQEKLPAVTVTNTHFTIEGIRDFRYDKKAAIKSTHYLTETYAFSNLKTVWFGLSHFGGHGLAHVFLSFEFFDGRYLVLSIEARLEQGESYKPWWGLLRRYEKLFVFGTEADIIGLRTHSRHERLLLYPLNLTEDMKQKLLKDYLLEAHQLETTPEFYNTLVDNCMTGILKGSGYFSTWDYITNIHILLPGLSDNLAQSLGLLDQSLSLDQLRRMAIIDPATSYPNDDNFSQQIRVNWSKEPNSENLSNTKPLIE